LSMRQLLALIASDYHVHYGDRDGSPARHWALFLPRVVANPSLHATILIRLAVAAPRWTLALWRNILLTKHTIDLGGNLKIGPGLNLPHPWGLVFGTGTEIGANCKIFHNVTFGNRAEHQRGMANRWASSTEAIRECPSIGDNVVIYMSTIIVGPVSVGDGAIVGARAWVDRDVAPGAIVSDARPRKATPAIRR
jgi:serine acetyltransferase